MAASSTDKFRKLSRKWVGQIGAGGVTDAVTQTIPLASSTGLPEDTAVDLVINRVDSTGTKTPSKEETITGVVSGDNIVTCIRGVEGTAQSHSAGSVVEVLLTASTFNSEIDGILEEHNQDGTHNKTGEDANLVSGTAGTENSTAKWNADGDLVDGYPVLDEDDLASDSNTSLATQQSIKAYVDALPTGIANVVEDTTPQLGGNLDVNGSNIINSTANHIAITPGTNKLVKIAALRRDDTTDSYVNNVVFLTGRKPVTLTSGASQADVSVSFGVTFSSAPVVMAVVSSATTVFGSVAEESFLYVSGQPTTSGFSCRVICRSGTWGGNRSAHIEWIAVGPLA